MLSRQRRARLSVTALGTASVALLAWYVVGTLSATATPTAAPQSHHSSPRRTSGHLAAVGPKMAAAIPTDARQVVLVTGNGARSSKATVSLWSRANGSWRDVSPPMSAHVGLDGWTTNHRAGDTETPIGVFGLTEAGGSLRNPGTRLPYEHNPAYFSRSMYVGNQPSNVFDYVVAINFNRRANTPPSDPVEPLGTARGGGIWLHVDDGQPTAGCVSVTRTNMVTVLRWLKPNEHPVIVMGDLAALAQ